MYKPPHLHNVHRSMWSNMATLLFYLFWSHNACEPLKDFWGSRVETGREFTLRKHFCYKSSYRKGKRLLKGTYEHIHSRWLRPSKVVFTYRRVAEANMHNDYIMILTNSSDITREITMACTCLKHDWPQMWILHI